MRQVLREFESNQLAILVALCGFLFVVLVVGILATHFWGIDWNGILGIAGMGTGSHVTTSASQAAQARSPNYQPPSAIAAGVFPASSTLPPAPPAPPHV